MRYEGDNFRGRNGLKRVVFLGREGGGLGWGWGVEGGIGSSVNSSSILFHVHRDRRDY